MAAPSPSAQARTEVAEVWDVVGLPDTAARDTAGIIEAACSGEIDALVIGGVDPADLVDPGVEEALAKTFVVSLEVRDSAVTDGRRRRPAGGAARREGGRLRQLGGPGPAVRRTPSRPTR